MLSTNQVLNKGRYRIINSFSQDETGGMYEAYDTVSSTKVVLRESIGRLGKVATSNQIEAINAAFAGGARVLAEISHESLVSVQDYFSEIDRQYLVLEAVTGSDLTKFLHSGENRPDLTNVVTWVNQLLNALNCLHNLPAPVIHRDITPENIKLTTGHKVKLLTAAIAADITPGGNIRVSDLLNGNKSFQYRPLEQLWDGLDNTSQRVILHDYDEKSAGLLMQALDARSDLYSLAASLYHVFTGVSPCDALERSIAILDGKPDPLQRPSDINDGIPAEISDVFIKAMSIRRENRFDSALIMQQVLKTAVVRVEERKAEQPAAVRPSSIPVQVEIKIEAEKASQPATVQNVSEPNDDDQLVLELEPDQSDTVQSIGTFEPLETEPFEEAESEAIAADPVGYYAIAGGESISVGEYGQNANLENEDYREPSTFNWRIPAIAVAVVLLSVVLAGAWYFTSTDSKTAKPSVTLEKITTQPEQPIQTTVSNGQSEAVQIESAPSDPTSDRVPAAGEPVRANGGARQSQMPVAQERVKKSAQLPAKTPPPKKKLTVEDLLN